MYVLCMCECVRVSMLWVIVPIVHKVCMNMVLCV